MMLQDVTTKEIVVVMTPALIYTKMLLIIGAMVVLHMVI